MASSSVAVSPSAQPDWRKMNKQALRDALASRGLDTNGLRPSLIQRLESSVKALTAAEVGATSVPDEAVELTDEPSQEQSLSQIVSSETQTLNIDSKILAPKTLTLQEDEETQVPISAGPSASKLDVGQSKFMAENGKNEHNLLNTTSHLTDLEKKRLRAERFGLGLQVSEQEKLALRAERFAGGGGKKSSAAREPEVERRKQRAARFGIVDEESRKKARQERFKPVLKEEKQGDSEADGHKARSDTATGQDKAKEI